MQREAADHSDLEDGHLEPIISNVCADQHGMQLEEKKADHFLGELDQLQTDINLATPVEGFNILSDSNLRQMAEKIMDKAVHNQLENIFDQVMNEDDDVVQKKSSVTPSKRVLPQTPVRWSKKREATADEDSLERAERLVAIKNLETTTKSGKNFNNSILSVPDSVFASNIQNVGISMGKVENDVFNSISDIKCGEVDRMHANQQSKEQHTETLDESDGEENNEIEYITLGHLCSGILEENVGKDDDHIGGDWQKVSKKKSSSSRKKLNIPAIAQIKKQVCK
ncbi:unnamed protein product [Urochloa humidicola]